MKKRVIQDPWFQMFGAIAAASALISAFETVSSRRVPPQPAPAAAVAAPAPAAAPPIPLGDAPAPAPSPQDMIIPSPQAQVGPTGILGDPGAVDMGGGVGPGEPIAPAHPAPPPKMTLTGTGVGNAQGIAAPPAGGAMRFLNNLLGGMRQQQAAQQQAALVQHVPLNLVNPARPGVFKVGVGADADTKSLRDAVFSAKSGDLILVEKGLYDGQVDVGGKTVRIRGSGAEPGDVTITWTGPGAVIAARNGGLDLENLRVERGAFSESPKTEPGGAIYAVGSTLSMRKVELYTLDIDAPPLIIEQVDKPTRITVIDSTFNGARANVVARGPVKASFTRVSFESRIPVAAWIDAVIELRDCRFSAADAVISAYESARVVVTGGRKPRIIKERGSDAASIELTFGARGAVVRAAGFTRDIFSRNRRPGQLP